MKNHGNHGPPLPVVFRLRLSRDEWAAAKRAANSDLRTLASFVRLALHEKLERLATQAKGNHDH